MLLNLAIAQTPHINAQIEQWCNTYSNVSKKLVHAIIEVESQYTIKCSRYEPHLFNDTNLTWYKDKIPNVYKSNRLAYSSIGIMQVLYGTARGMGLRGDPKKLFKLDESLKYGIRYLSFLTKKYKGNKVYISAAYNAGRVKIRKGKIINQEYVDKVMWHFNVKSVP
jgi:soluble lytic murein transglycosylase-like protein